MNNRKIWIPEILCERMISAAEKNDPLEEGGILMGYRAANKDIVITDLIDSGPNAKRSRIRFSPDHEYQLSEIADMYTKTEGDITYIGDWHTHPEGVAELSLLDKRTLTKVGLTPESKNQEPVMLILAKYPNKWTIKAVCLVYGKLFMWPFVSCMCDELVVVIHKNN